MPNIENLMPIEKVNASKTREERRQSASKAGKASAKKRQQNKTFKDLCDIFVDSKITSEEMIEQMKKMGISDEDVSYKMAMVVSMVKEAVKGNTKAFELIRDTLGEKPSENVNLNNTITNPYSNLTEEELRKLVGEK